MDTPKKPSVDVLNAFMIKDKPIHLTGGQGTTWKAGNFIIKPTGSEDETVWCAEIIEQLPQDSFRIAKHKKTRENEWVYKGWAVLDLVEGEHVKHRWDEKVEVCRGFNNLLKGIPKPDFIDKRTDPWAIAGKMAWGELPLSYDERLHTYVEKVKRYLKPISSKDQIIHGDITGNMLFADGLLPGIIDFTPTWRSKEYALAILIVDAITWEEADESIISLVDKENNIFQFILRAALFRTLVVSEFNKQFKIDRLSEIQLHERTLDIIVSKIVDQ